MNILSNTIKYLSSVFVLSMIVLSVLAMSEVFSEWIFVYVMAGILIITFNFYLLTEEVKKNRNKEGIKS